MLSICIKAVIQFWMQKEVRIFLKILYSSLIFIDLGRILEYDGFPQLLDAIVGFHIQQILDPMQL